MKRIAIVLCALVLMQTNLKAAEKERVVNGKIKKVTIFMQSAQVFKEARVTIPKGTSNVVFNDVSPYITRSSLQAAGNGKFTILNTQYRYKVDKPKEKKEASPELLQQIRVLKDSLYVSQLRTNKNNQLIKALDREERLVLGHRLINGQTTSDSLELLINTSSYLRRELKDLANWRYVLSLRSKELQDRTNKIQNELNELYALQRSQNVRPRSIYHHQVVVTVYSSAKTDALVKLNYLTGNAGWSPQYDLKATDHQSDISLLYKARVFQNTGEDWKQVKIKVSNANPNIGNTKPQLPVWFINFKRYMRRSQTKKAAYYLDKDENVLEDMEVKEMASIHGTRAEKAKMLTQYTNKVQNFSSVEFEISIPMNVKSDGKAHYLDLKKEKVKTDFMLYLVPKLEKDAFVVARLTGWESLNLLTGPANIYYGNTFIGRTVVDPSVLEDTLEVSMGRDRSVYVEREKVSGKTKNKLVSNHKVYTAKYSIKIKNKNKGDIKLTVEDHIPVSKNEKIEVNTVQSSGDLIQSTGKISWKLNLKGYEKKTLGYEFSVKYPKDETIQL